MSERMQSIQGGNGPNRVNVEIPNTTLSECRLHGSLLRGAGPRVIKPVCIDGTSGARKNPRYLTSGKTGVQDADLVCNLRGPVIDISQIQPVQLGGEHTGHFLPPLLYPC
jgi:hypothetical protein